MKLNKLYILIIVFALAIAQSDSPDDTSPPPEEEKKKWSLFKIFQKKDKSDEEVAPQEEVEQETEESEKKGLFNRKKKKAKFEGGGIFQRFRKKAGESDEDVPSDEDVVRIPFTPVDVDETIKSSAGIDLLGSLKKLIINTVKIIKKTPIIGKKGMKTIANMMLITIYDHPSL